MLRKQSCPATTVCHRVLRLHSKCPIPMLDPITQPFNNSSSDFTRAGGHLGMMTHATCPSCLGPWKSSHPSHLAMLASLSCSACAPYFSGGLNEQRLWNAGDMMWSAYEVQFFCLSFRVDPTGSPAVDWRSSPWLAYKSLSLLGWSRENSPRRDRQTQAVEYKSSSLSQR